MNDLGEDLRKLILKIYNSFLSADGRVSNSCFDLTSVCLRCLAFKFKARNLCKHKTEGGFQGPQKVKALLGDVGYGGMKKVITSDQFAVVLFVLERGAFRDTSLLTEHILGQNNNFYENGC